MMTLSAYNVGKLAKLATSLDNNDLTGYKPDNKVATTG
jgi:hypothetical protein